ncbi:MAG: aspartate dehydrogenase domain-containing protein [bacterium]
MSEKTLRIGIVGCGAIGSEIARAIDKREIKAELICVCDKDGVAAEKLSSSIGKKPAIVSMEDLVAQCDMAVEAAGGGAVAPLIDLCAKAGIDLLVMSVGGLKPEHFEKFESGASSLYIPSGAVAGIDGILALAGAGDIESLTLTTIKPPAGLRGTPYLDEKGVSLDGLTEPLTVFEGSPVEAIRCFPKNINVSTTIALASAAKDKMIVRIIADPHIAVNTHEVRLVSPLGSLTMRVENKPSPTNPKTSALAYLSAIAALKKITSKVKIGT